MQEKQIVPFTQARKGDCVIRASGRFQTRYSVAVVDRVTRGRIVIDGQAYHRETGSPAQAQGAMAGWGWLVDPTPEVLESIEERRREAERREQLALAAEDVKARAEQQIKACGVELIRGADTEREAIAALDTTIQTLAALEYMGYDELMERYGK